jgi:hypothetical protein
MKAYDSDSSWTLSPDDSTPHDHENTNIQILFVGRACAACWSPSSALALPKIKVLATAARLRGAGHPGRCGYKSGTFSVDDLIKAVPQMTNIALLWVNRSRTSAVNDEP